MQCVRTLLFYSQSETALLSYGFPGFGIIYIYKSRIRSEIGIIVLVTWLPYMFEYDYVIINYIMNYTIIILISYFSFVH